MWESRFLSSVSFFSWTGGTFDPRPKLVVGWSTYVDHGASFSRLSIYLLLTLDGMNWRNFGKARRWDWWLEMKLTERYFIWYRMIGYERVGGWRSIEWLAVKVFVGAGVMGFSGAPAHYMYLVSSPWYGGGYKGTVFKFLGSFLFLSPTEQISSITLAKVSIHWQPVRLVQIYSIFEGGWSWCQVSSWRGSLTFGVTIDGTEESEKGRWDGSGRHKCNHRRSAFRIAPFDTSGFRLASKYLHSIAHGVPYLSVSYTITHNENLGHPLYKKTKAGIKLIR